MTASCITAAICGLFGIVLSALWLFGSVPNNGLLSLVGAALLIVTFSLLILAAHCMDKIDRLKRLIKTAEMNL